MTHLDAPGLVLIPRAQTPPTKQTHQNTASLDGLADGGGQMDSIVRWSLST